MKYFIDFEFLEGDVPVKIFGLNVPKWLIKPNNTIQPISVGICSSDGREYYAISKEFNLKEAWNRFDWKQKTINDSIPRAYKEYWLRDNVLKPIFYDMLEQTLGTRGVIIGTEFIPALPFTYKNFKRLLKECGKTNKQIAEEILDFVNTNGSFVHKVYDKKQKNKIFDDVIENYGKPQFYGYYANYDWVVFYWLFGKMIDLPKGFPMYCIDLKQMLDYFENNIKLRKENNGIEFNSVWNKIDTYKQHPNYPKQTNEYNALADARWNYELYKFIQKL